MKSEMRDLIGRRKELVAKMQGIEKQQATLEMRRERLLEELAEHEEKVVASQAEREKVLDAFALEDLDASAVEKVRVSHRTLIDKGEDLNGMISACEFRKENLKSDLTLTKKEFAELNEEIWMLVLTDLKTQIREKCGFLVEKAVAVHGLLNIACGPWDIGFAFRNTSSGELEGVNISPLRLQSLQAELEKSYGIVS